MEETDFLMTNAIGNCFSFTFGRCFLNTWLICSISRSHKNRFSLIIIHRMKWRANIEDYEEDCIYNLLLCELQLVRLLVCACRYHLERRCAHRINTPSQDFIFNFVWIVGEFNIYNDKERWRSCMHTCVMSFFHCRPQHVRNKLNFEINYERSTTINHDFYFPHTRSRFFSRAYAKWQWHMRRRNNSRTTT